MLRSFSRLLLLIPVICLVFVPSSCKKKISNENRVVEHLLADFERLNPFNSTGANETYAEEQIFERLLRIDPKTMRYDVPWLADSLPVESADHLQFDFRIRKGIVFADGQPLTGDDVIFSLKALKNPLNTYSGQKRVYVDAIHSAELIDGDPYRVRFKFWKPYYLAREAAFGDALFILPKHTFDPQGLTDKYSWDDIGKIVEHTGADELDSAKLASMHPNPAMQEFADWFVTSELGRDPKYIQGSGPYMLDRWETQNMVQLKRNPRYVNKGNSPLGIVGPDFLVYKVISDWNAAITALKSRTLDLMGFVPPDQYVRIDTGSLKHISKTTFPLPAFTILGFNQKNPIFEDIKVRWAMAYLVDRKTIIDVLFHGYAKLTESPTFYGRPEYNSSLPEIPYDPARAKLILDSAGWRDHDGDGILDKNIKGKLTPFRFTFLVNSGNDTRKRILLIVAENMRKVGIDAQVSTVEWSVFLDRMRDHNFEARYGSWQQDPYEGDNYQLYHSSQAKNRGSNYDNYMSPKADRLLEEIRSMMDQEKRYALQRELQKVLYEEQANLFLWVPETPVAWVNRFDNVSWNSVRPGYNIAAWKVRGSSGASAKLTPF